jgi:hypothetical protein
MRKMFFDRNHKKFSAIRNAITIGEVIPIPLTKINAARGIGECGMFHPIARMFMQDFYLKWHAGIVADYFGGGHPDLGAAFLFEVVPKHQNLECYTWVIAGKLPLVYLVTDEAPNWVRAFEVYCSLARDWIAGESVEYHGPLYPFEATHGAVSKPVLSKLISQIEMEILVPNKNLLRN